MRDRVPHGTDGTTPRSDPTHDLMVAARAGDARAVEQLLTLHRPRIVVICRRVLRDDADADDAAQEALVAIVRGLGKFDGRSSFATWSHRIATNVCLDELRRRTRRPQGEPGELDRFEDGRPDPADEVAASDDRTRLVAALDSLPEEFRLPVVLRDVADLDYATIAEQLDLPAGTVRSRIARGRARLASIVEQDGSLGDAGNRSAVSDVGRTEPT